MSNMSGLSREVEGTDAMHLAEQTAAAFFSPANDYQRPETGFTFSGLQPLASTTTAGESYSLSALPSGITDSNRQTLSDIAASVVPTIKSIEHEDAVAGTTLETPKELLLPNSAPLGPGNPRGSTFDDAAAMADTAAGEERANYLAWERSVARGGANENDDSDEEERRLWHNSDDDRDRPKASSAGAASTFARGTVPSRPLSSGSSNESPVYVRIPPPTLSDLAQNSVSRGSTPVEPLVAAAADTETEQGQNNREIGEGVGVVLSSSTASDGRRSEGPAPSSKERAFERQRPTSSALTANSAQADPATSGSSSSLTNANNANNANNYSRSSSSSTNGGPGWVVQSGGASPYFPAGPHPSEHAVDESKGPRERWSASSLSSQPQQQPPPVPMAVPTATGAGDRRRTGSTSRGGSVVGDVDEVKRLQEQQMRDSEALRDLQVETERLQSGRSTPLLSGGRRSCPPQMDALLPPPPRGDLMHALDTFSNGVRDKGWHEERDHDDDDRLRRGVQVERRKGGEPRNEASNGTRPQQVHVQVTRADWDDLRAAASERAVLFHEKGDLEQQLHALAENLTAAKARARQAERTAKHLQVCLDSTSEDFAQYRAQVSWQHQREASAAKTRGLRHACAEPFLQEGAMASFQKQQQALEQALGDANARAARNAKRRARLEGRVRVSESRCRQLELLCADVLREVVQDAPQLRWHARSAYEALRQVVTSPSPLLHPPNATVSMTPFRGARVGDTAFLNASSSSSSASSSFGLGPEYSTSRRRNSSRREPAVHSSAPILGPAGSFVDQSGADFSRSRGGSSQRPNPHLNPSAQSFSGSRQRDFGAGLNSSWGGMYNEYNEYEDYDSDDDVDYTGMAAEAADAEVTREAAANQRALKAELDATKLQLATETKRADALTLENKRLAQLCQEYASQYTAASFEVPLPLQKSSAY